MLKVVFAACLTFASFLSHADILTCDALKARVDAKLQAKGIKTYTLAVVPITDSKTAASGTPATQINGKEVGTCDGGTKRVIYTKGN